MKKIKKLKLADIAYKNLSKRELKNVVGGTTYTPVACRCACAYAGSGGSSTNDNCVANYKGGAIGGLYSPGDDGVGGATCYGYRY